MKTRQNILKGTVRQTACCLALMIALAATSAQAQPQITSWQTNYSGKYARIYTSDADKNSGTTSTTWSRGMTTQTSPAYNGIYLVGNSANWFYFRSSGLATHIMGPWYLDAGHLTNFPAFPKSTLTMYRIPRTQTVSLTNALTGLGAIGYFVDGVAMFDTRDAFYWNGSAEANGTGNWNREAWVNEGITFDPGQAHQPMDGTHHYHANPIALRYQLGDHVDFNASTKTYSESTNAVLKHSPILGWVRDGYPIYGPYGYSSASNSLSGIRRMASGFIIRNGQNGTQNLTANGRTNIPPWAVRFYGGAANAVIGPAVSSSFPLGRYMEDNDYLGDLGYTKGTDFDLDEYNGRWCYTPEFPGGIYAYFVSVSTNGTPVFPYNIGRCFKGNPTGGTVVNLAETIVTNFVGGSNTVIRLSAPAVDKSSGNVTLTWSSTEGGTYVISGSTIFSNWTSNFVSSVTATGATATVTHLGAAKTNAARYYKVTRSSLATSVN